MGTYTTYASYANAISPFSLDMGKPVLMLEEQFRMHPEIASFPSRHVYSGRLKSHRLDHNK